MNKTTRFKVFNRDMFTCQYCGKKAPEVKLEVDHSQPLSKGGSNDLENLVTSCQDCNRGKSNNTLNSPADEVIKECYEWAKKSLRGQSIIRKHGQNAFDVYFKSVFTKYIAVAPDYIQKMRNEKEAYFGA